MSSRATCDIEGAIGHIEASLAATPEGDSSRPGRLSSLGKCFHVRYENRRDMNDLDAAISCEQEAVAATPVDLPSRAHTLICLGTNLRLRYKLRLHSSGLNLDEDRARAFECFLEAWNCQMAPPNTRVQAVWRAVKFFPSSQSVTLAQSSSLLEEAVGLLPKISLRSLERGDQQRLLSNLYGLSSLAASYALEAGRGAYTALKLLELGRGVITGFAIDNRSEMSELQETHPALFESLNNLRAEANSPLPERVPGDQTGHFVSKKRLALDQMDVILTRIREIPAYNDFLLPPSPESLMKMAEHGTIVIMCSTSLRSDAIIVTRSAIKSIELPKLLYKDAKKNMRDMSTNQVKGSLKTRATRNKTMIKLLCWLWDVAVGPVLKEIQPQSKTERIWWIGIGELSRAPFHAAGYHKTKSSRNTISQVISSYIPTIKALTYARQRKLNLTTRPDSRLLLVTMPTTPGNPALSGVEEEVNAIVRIVENGGSPGDPKTKRATVLRQPSAATVMAQLPLFDAAHFACHGVSDSNDPSKSSLLLLNKSETGETDTIDRLTVQDIFTATSSNAQLAYLSACSTADNPAIALADETIHLASAFQLAGFNHVLATLWQSKDEACRKVAESFYTRLFDGGVCDSSDSHLKVSIALHEAVKKVRDESPTTPLTWAPFIHTGA